MNIQELKNQLATAIADAQHNVEAGHASAAELYRHIKEISELAGEALKDEALVAELKHEVDQAGKGFDFGGFTITHSYRTTYDPILPAELEPYKALIKDAEAESRKAANLGKPGAVIVSKDGEAYEVPAGTFKSASDVFTLKYTGK